MESKGFDEVFFDEYGNVIGRIAGKHPGKKILFDGHMDTVPVGNPEDWDTDPFTPTVKNG